MRVLKRGNRGFEPVHMDKITSRISSLCNRGGITLNVDPVKVSISTIQNIFDGITTEELDRISASVAESMKLTHPDYGRLADRLCISNLHKTTPMYFSTCMRELNEAHWAYDHSLIKHNEADMAFDAKHGLALDKTVVSPLWAVKHSKFIADYAEELDEMINHENDYLYSYGGLFVLQSGYLARLPGLEGRVYDRPQYMMMRVAVALHIDEKEPLAMIKRYYNILSAQDATNASPTLFNACSYKQQLGSCFLYGSQDSIEGIMGNAYDSSIISKMAGGIGIHMHTIRCTGTYIRGTKGASCGVIKQLRIYDDLVQCWNQGGKRKGAIAIYLEPWHGDIMQFLQLKMPAGAESMRARNLFYGMWIPDLFVRRAYNSEIWSLFSGKDAYRLCEVYDGMDDTDAFTELYERYEKESRAVGQLPAADVLEAIFTAQRESGVPYVCFKDHVNRRSNQKNMGTIKSSNLCVAGETLILTKTGYWPIGDLQDKEVEVWNGDEWSRVTVKKTGVDQELITVRLSNGSIIECTPYHKFLIAEGNYDAMRKLTYKTCSRIEATNLKNDMKLMKFDTPVIEGDETLDFKYAYTHGFFCGDGTTQQRITKGVYKSCTLYGPKKDLLPYLDIKSTSGGEDSLGRINTILHEDMEDKFKVPLNASKECRLEWFAGLMDADGCVVWNGNNASIQIVQCEFEFLQQVMLMLQTLGIHSKIAKNAEAGKFMLPNGKGGLQEYECRAKYRLTISSHYVWHLRELGWAPHRLNFDGMEKPQRQSTQFITVSSIENFGRKADTFCFTEPKNNAGTFGGVLLGNCSEIMEWSSNTSYATCTLASLVVSKFINNDGTIDHKRMHEVVRILVRGLDNVIDQNQYPVKECRTNSDNLRPIGLGIQGLADLFHVLRIPYESAEAARIDLEINETIYHAAVTESIALAEERGSYTHFEGSPTSKGILQPHMWLADRRTRRSITGAALPCPQIFSGRYDWVAQAENVKRGIRNSLLIAHMPTVSTSAAMNNSESFMPLQSNIYTQSGNAGSAVISNNLMIDHLIELGLWNGDMKSVVVNNGGSIASITEIPATVRAIYKTVWEISQKTIMDRTAVRCSFVDQAASLNLHLAENTSKMLRSVFMHGWDLGLKTGSYYIRTKAAVCALQNIVTTKAAAEVDRSLIEGSCGDSCSA